MQLREAMIWWDDREEHSHHPHLEQVKVLPRLSNGQAQEYYYLGNSVGACFARWDSADPVLLASYVLSIFNRMVVDGVPADAAHAELMKIDEYQEWHKHHTGPFGDVHWAWDIKQSEAA